MISADEQVILQCSTVERELDIIYWRYEGERKKELVLDFMFSATISSVCKNGRDMRLVGLLKKKGEGNGQEVEERGILLAAGNGLEDAEPRGWV